MPTSYLDRLPLELVKFIFDNIGDDLIAHFTFSKLRPDIWDYCYRGRGQEFWEPILRASGLGVIRVDDEPEFHYDEDSEIARLWEELAIDCAEHALECQYPKCGMARLRENEHLMQLGLNDASRSANVDTHVPRPAAMRITSDTVWSSIAFKRRRPRGGDSRPKPETWMSVSYLRVDGPDGMLGFGDELQDHPLIWRSFVTFPPISRFQILVMQRLQGPHNSFGVTVADLLQWIVMQGKMSNSTLITLSQSVGLRRPTIDPMHNMAMYLKNWSAAEVKKTFRDLRDWFMIVRWVGVKFFRSGLGVEYLDFVAKPQLLPAKYRDFEEMATSDY